MQTSVLIVFMMGLQGCWSEPSTERKTITLTCEDGRKVTIQFSAYPRRAFTGSQKNLFTILERLERGESVDINAPVDGIPPLCEAVALTSTLGPSYETASYLIRKGASVTVFTEKDHNTPLHQLLGNLATSNQLTAFLLAHGADVTYKNQKGETPLDSLEESGYEEHTVTFMLTHLCKELLKQETFLKHLQPEFINYLRANNVEERLVAQLVGTSQPNIAK